MRALRYKICGYILPTEYSNPSVTKEMIENDRMRRTKLLVESQQRLLMGNARRRPRGKAYPSGRSLTQWGKWLYTSRVTFAIAATPRKRT